MAVNNISYPIYPLSTRTEKDYITKMIPFFFCSVYKNKPLSYTSTRENILKLLALVGGSLNLGLHSLRAGGATTVANSDVKDRNWKRHGRWKSDKSKDGYVVDSLDSRLEVFKKLGL